ncbi:MAG: tetratricopeptide repeat protein [candidate division Zixibacteria bacterium]|nr:tetratricopeptide repeat protein [candidate division Zixibacteria bacterium]
MKKSLNKIFTLILVSLLWLGSQGFSAPIPTVIKLTGHPDIDFEPAVSSDGQWIAYTTFRDGDFNIYLKPTTRGLPVKLTSHSSADFSPAYGKDNSEIFFVSRRDDALGDIYRMDTDIGSTKRLTKYQGYDTDPVVSPDGKILAFCSDRETGYPEIFIAKTNGDIIRRLTNGGAMNPAWSPRGDRLAYVALDMTGLGAENRLAIVDTSGNIEYPETGNGPVMNPSFSPDGDLILFTKYDVDTDRDGILTINDTPTISAIYPESGKKIKLLFNAQSVYYPRLDNNSKWLYFVHEEGGNTDLARMDFGSLKRILEIPDSLYQYGLRLSSSSDEQATYAAIQYLESYAALYPSSERAADALLKCGELYLRLGFSREAELSWRSIEKLQADPAQSLIAQIYSIELTANNQWELDRRSALRKALTSLNKIRERGAEIPEVLAKTYYVEGLLLSRYGKFAEAMRAFTTIIDSFPGVTDDGCKALLRLGDNYGTLNPDDRISNASNYIRVLSQYPSENDYADSAVTYSLNQYDKLPLTVRIEGVRNLLGRFEDIRRLQVAGEYYIAESLEAGGKYLSAVDQYRLVQISYDDFAQYAQQAILQSARLNLLVGETDEAVAVLDSLHKSDAINEDIQREAGKALYRYYISMADSMFFVGDIHKSRAIFEELISDFTERGDCNWGFIRSCSRIGDLDYARDFYRSIPDSIENQRGITYGKSLLALERYIKHRKEDELREARDLLENLNDEYFEWILPYIALGKTYLEFERGQVDQDGGGFSERAIDISLMGLNYLSKDAPPQQEFHLKLNMASGYYFINQYQHAFTYYDDCYDYIIRQADEELLVDYLWNYGESALQTDSLDIASSSFGKLLEIAEERADTELKLRLMKKLGFVYMLDEDYDETRRYFRMALEIYKARVDLKGEAEMLKALAVVNFMDEEPNPSISYATESDSVYSALGTSDDLQTSGLLLGRLVFLPFDFQLASMEEFKIGGSFYPRGFPRNENRRLLRELEGVSEMRLGEIEKATTSLRRKMVLAEKSGDKRSAAIIANKIGNIYTQAGNPDSAIAYYRESIELSQDAELVSGIGTGVVNLTNLLLSFPEYIYQMLPEEVVSHEELMSRTLQQLPGTVSALKMYLYAASGNWYFIRYQKYLEERMITIDNQLNSADSYRDAISTYLDQFQQTGAELELAENYYKEALNIAGIILDEHAYCAINLSLAAMYLEFGHYSELAEILATTEDIAIENGFGDILVRISLMEGLLDSNINVIEASMNDAVNNLRTLRGERNPLGSYLQTDEIDESFKHYLRILIESGRSDEALNSIELLRSMKLVGEISRFPLREFRSELHKVYWLKVKYLDEMVDSLTSTIRSLQTQEDIQSKRMADSLNVELEDIRTELVNSLDRIQEEFPALSPMVYASKPRWDKLKEVFSGGEIVLDYYLFRDGVGIWLINDQDWKFIFKPIDMDSLQAAIDEVVTSQEAQEFLFETLFSDFREGLENSGYVTIIPDGELYEIPFALLNNGYIALNDICDYSISSSVEMIINGYENRRIPASGTIRLSDLPGDDEIGLDITEAIPDSLTKSLSEYGVVIFEQGIKQQAGYPLGSRLDVPIDNPPKLSRLFTYNLKSKTVILRSNKIEDLAELMPVLQATFNYAGSPSVIFLRWDILDSVFSEFLNTFIPLLDDYDVASALGQSRARLKKAYPNTYHWAAFEQIGYKGMNRQEEKSFAQHNFGIIMQKGILAANQSDWQDALSYFREAHSLASLLGIDKSKIEIILQRIVLSAFRAGEYSIAEEYQKETLKLAREDNNREKSAEAILLLRNIASQAGDYEHAADYQRQYMDLTGAMSDSARAAEGFRNIASLLDSGGKFREALSAIDTSLAYTDNVRYPEEYGTAMYIRGRILINLERFRDAASALEESVGSFESVSSAETAKAYQLLGWAYFQQNRYFDARSFLSRAFALYDENNSGSLAECSRSLASAEWIIGDFDSANAHADLAIEFNKKLGNSHSQLDAILIKALIKIYSGYSTEGERIMINGYSLAERINSSLHKMVFADNMGRFYLREGEFDKAIEFLRLAISQMNDEGNKDDKIESLLDLALAYANAGNPEQFENTFTRLDSLLDKSRSAFLQAKRDLIYSSSLMALGDFSQAIKSSENSLEESDIAEFPLLLWRQFYILAKCYYQRENEEASLRYLSQSTEILDGIPIINNGEIMRTRLPHYPWQAYELLAKANYAQNDYNESVIGFQKANQYRQTALLSNYYYRFAEPAIDTLVSRLQEARITYFACSNRLRKGDEEESVSECRRRMEQSNSEFILASARLQETYPPLALALTVPDINSEDLNARLDADPTLLYYQTSDELYRFLVNTSGTQGYKIVLEHNLNNIFQQYVTTISTIGNTERLDSVSKPILLGDWEIDTETGELNVIPIGEVVNFPLDYLLSKFSDVPTNELEINAFPSIYDLFIPNSNNKPIESLHLIAPEEIEDGASVDFIDKAVSQQVSRAVYPIERVENVSSILATQNLNCLVSDIRINESDAPLLEFYFSSNPSGEDNSRMRLKELLEMYPDSASIFQLENFDWKRESEFANNKLLLWRILLSSGLEGAILPRWEQRELEKGLYLKHYLRAIETTPSGNAILNIKQEMTNSGRSHPYYWSGYYYIGYAD